MLGELALSRYSLETTCKLNFLKEAENYLKIKNSLKIVALRVFEVDATILMATYAPYCIDFQNAISNGISARLNSIR